MAGGLTKHVERRREVRVMVHAEARVARTRFVGGADGRLANVATRGVLIATPHRAVPGRTVLVHWPRAEELPRIRALVVRCAVRRLRGEDGVEYAVALELCEPVPALKELATHRG